MVAMGKPIKAFNCSDNHMGTMGTFPQDVKCFLNHMVAMGRLYERKDILTPCIAGYDPDTHTHAVVPHDARTPI